MFKISQTLFVCFCRCNFFDATCRQIRPIFFHDEILGKLFSFCLPKGSLKNTNRHSIHLTSSTKKSCTLTSLVLQKPYPKTVLKIFVKPAKKYFLRSDLMFINGKREQNNIICKSFANKTLICLPLIFIINSFF